MEKALFQKEREGFGAQRWREVWSIVVLLMWCKVSFQKPVITPSPGPPVVAHLTHVKDCLIGAACHSMKKRGKAHSMGSVTCTSCLMTQTKSSK